VDSTSQDVAAVIEQLRSQDIDVVRVSYSDMIGIDRGRDVLLSELPAALGHGLPFSRCVYHTSPMGETIPIQGGIEDGLPDIHVKPDLSTLAPLPWEPGAMACLGDTFLADGALAPESPRTVVGRVAEHLAQLDLRAIVGPELEYFVCEPDSSAGTGFARYANSPAMSTSWAARATLTACCCGPCATCARPSSRSLRPITSTARASSR